MINSIKVIRVKMSLGNGVKMLINKCLGKFKIIDENCFTFLLNDILQI
jgi:hypothetical protein